MKKATKNMLKERKVKKEKKRMMSRSSLSNRIWRWRVIMRSTMALVMLS